MLPPGDSSDEWDDVAELYNAGISKKLRKMKGQIHQKFKQITSGPATGGGGRRSDAQEKGSRLLGILTKLDEGGSVSRTEERFLKEINSLKFEQKRFIRDEFDDVATGETAAAEEETTPTAEEKTTVAAEEETTVTCHYLSRVVFL